MLVHTLLGWGNKFLLAWIPLFVAIDPIGMVPIFVGLTHNATTRERRAIARGANLTAAVVAIVFMLLGKWVFSVLGISVADFQIAGGLILFILATGDIIGRPGSVLSTDLDIAIVPLGMPIIAGPAMLTTLLILVDSVGFGFTLLALVINILLLTLALHFCERIVSLVGIRGLRALHKIVALLLAAIAVSMIRRGWQMV